MKFVRASLLGVAVTLLALTLAGFVGAFRYCELLADFRPYYLAFGVAMAVLTPLCFRGLRSRLAMATVAAVGMTVVINCLEVLPWIMDSDPVPGTNFKVIAFNVENVNRQFADTRAFVQREAPDVAMFCESVESWPAELLPLREQMPFHTRLDNLTMDVFSRHPIVRTQLFSYGPARGFAAIGLLVREREITFVVAHAAPRHWFGSAGFRSRTAMLEEGLGERSATLSKPIVIVGDLNASPWSPAYKTMIRKSGFVAARRGSGLVMTHHGDGIISGWLWRPIDHCLFSSEVRGRLSTGPDLGSDHLPIIAQLVLPSPRR